MKLSSLRFLSALAAGALLVTALLNGLGAAIAEFDILSSFAPLVALGAFGLLVFYKRVGRPAAVIALLAFALASARIVPELIHGVPIRQAAVPGRSLTVVAFNVWDESPDPLASLRAIIATNADVVALFESAGTFHPYLAQLKARYPYRLECRASDSGGCAILSKTPFLASGVLSRSVYGLALGWVRVIAPDGKPVTIVGAHLVHPNPVRPQAAQREALVEKTEELGRDDMVLVGDFNLTPWSFAMQRLDRDLFPLKRLSRALPTWPARLPFSKYDLRVPLPVLPIDHVYAGGQFRAAKTRILPAAGSDHYGIMVVLQRLSERGIQDERHRQGEDE